MAIRSTTIHRDRERPPVPQASTTTTDALALASLLGIEIPRISLAVTQRTVLGLPAAWACVSRITNAVAQMMTGADVYRGRELVDRPPVVDRPNVNYGRFVFWKEVAATALMRGNYVALLVDPDESGYPQQVVPLPIDHVNCFINEFGRIVYEVGGVEYNADQVLHVRIGVTVPGDPWCLGVVEAHRRGLSAQLDEQGMRGDVFRNGAVPTGVVQLDTAAPTTDQVTAVKTSWVGALGGQRTVAVIGNRMNYTPVTWSADDAQFIESSQFSVAEMALMFGLRPTDLDATIGGTNLTYGNRQDDALQRIVDSYMPVVVPIEEAWSDLLPNDETVKGNVEALLRATTIERYESYRLGREVGVYASDNEVREIEGRPLLKAIKSTLEEVENDES